MANLGKFAPDKEENSPNDSEQMEEDSSHNEIEDVVEYDLEEETDEFTEEDTEDLAVVSRQLDMLDTILSAFEPKVDRIYEEAQELLKSSRETRQLLSQERQKSESGDQQA